MRVLLIEDDEETARFIVRGLRQSHHLVDHAKNGMLGLQQAMAGEYEVLIVDRMLPEIDGLAVIRELRQEGRTTPVLVLSALSEVDDKVEGLRSGGDDYLAKPFHFTELIARLEALRRRLSSSPENPLLTLADLKMNRLRHTVEREGRRIELQPREYRLLEYLLRHADQVVTRTMLLENVWDYHFDPQTNVIDVHISRLRNKIDKPFRVQLLQTVRGAGYMLSASQS